MSSSDHPPDQRFSERVDVYVPPDLDDDIEAELGYGDSKSGWIREAARQRLARETASEQSDKETEN